MSVLIPNEWQLCHDVAAKITGLDPRQGYPDRWPAEDAARWSSAVKVAEEAIDQERRQWLSAMNDVVLAMKEKGTTHHTTEIAKSALRVLVDKRNSRPL